MSTGVRLRRPAAELYAQAQRTDNPATRGRLLEDVLLRLFETAHFDVEKNAGAAAPRQTDLVARYGERVYLVEAKWTRRPAGIPELDALRTRLSRATRGAIGVLVSVGGFAASVVEDVGHHRRHPLLLLSAIELERLVHGGEGLRDLLRRKEDALALSGRVLVTSTDPTAAGDARRGAWRRGAPTIVEPSGRTVPWVRATGSFDVWLPALRLPDPDWRWAGHTGSVYTTAAVRDRGPGTVHRVVEELDRIGWLESHCSWALRQAGANWFGFGATGLIEALERWTDRYAAWAGAAHHTEELAATGQADGSGIWILEADIDAGRPRWVTSCELSAVLEGWPLDVEPLRRLMRVVGAEEPQVLRTLMSRVVTTDRLPRDEPAVLDVRARIVVRETVPDGSHEDWVVGVIARHPGLSQIAEEVDRPPWREWTRDNDVLPVALRSWHQHDTVDRTYTLLRSEWSELPRSIPDVLVADWD
ncbi:restriction endonuclease [Geodermatophilus obscurus]|uniref:restriction endonuclease n=1 Tax=Geodermatophilus obscurus TaxID=1861 RepID=UPI001588161C|nr:restriction endonuclease [Geodermatophilus obscurus]